MDVYSEPPEWKSAAIEKYGTDIGTQLFERGWFKLDTIMRKEFLVILAARPSTT